MSAVKHKIFHPKQMFYKYMYKIILIDDKLYSAALMQDTEIFGIINLFNDFAMYTCTSNVKISPPGVDNFFQEGYPKSINYN